MLQPRRRALNTARPRSRSNYHAFVVCTYGAGADSHVLYSIMNNVRALLFKLGGSLPAAAMRSVLDGLGQARTDSRIANVLLRREHHAGVHAALRPAVRPWACRAARGLCGGVCTVRDTCVMVCPHQGCPAPIVYPAGEGTRGDYLRRTRRDGSTRGTAGRPHGSV